jgi:hypothetical protein
MNWDAIGAAGELIGAFAVVVSIVYLSTQIRSNTRATKASAGFEAAHSWATHNEQIVALNPELKSKIVESYQTQYSWNDFSPEERLDITLLNRALFQKLEGQYYLLKYDFLDKGIWAMRSAWAASLISQPFYEEWWVQEKKQRIYSEEFIAEIESVEAFRMQTAGVEEADA